MKKQKLKRSDIIYPELSYEVVGLIFRVDNNLGAGHQEKHYQKALAEEFREADLSFREQVVVPLEYKEKSIGRYFLDFVIEDKIALEIKKDNKFSRKNVDQLHSYLQASGLKLGMLVNFGKAGVQYKRVVNIEDQKIHSN